MNINKYIMNWDWYSDSATVHLLIHLVLIAENEDREWRGLEIKRGQTADSLSMLSSSTGISIKRIRARLDVLEESGLITKSTSNHRSIITIVDYDSYFSDKTTEKPKASPKPKKRRKIKSKPKEDIEVLIPEPQYKNLSKFEEYNIPEEYKPHVEDWLQYKSEKKDKYTPMGFKKLCTRLVNKYRDDVESLKNDIDVSIANNWKGIHRANNNNNNNFRRNDRRAKPTTIDISEEFDRDLFG